MEYQEIWISKRNIDQPRMRWCSLVQAEMPKTGKANDNSNCGVQVQYSLKCTDVSNNEYLKRLRALENYCLYTII